MTTVSAFQTLSYIAEGCIFIYVGLDTLDPLKWKVRRPQSDYTARLRTFARGNGACVLALSVRQRSCQTAGLCRRCKPSDRH